MIKTGVTLALLLGVSLANAAGLGKLTVNSSLGQVLNAEIDLVSVQPGELDALIARVAPPEAFRDARIEYSSSLRLLRFSVEKRPSGQPYLKVTSIAPINEPFVDALIEVIWPQGRIQREYPILLDPPGYNDARVAAPTVAAAPPSAPAAEPARPAAVPVAPAPAPVAAAPSEPATAATGSPSAQAELGTTPGGAAPAGGDTYGPVQRGENLRKIAEQTKPADVSLDQMLVALYRENKSAFINNNMNRLKAGQILKVPSSEEVARLETREVNQEIRTHVSDWKAYREQLAGGVAAVPARPEATGAAAGRIGTAAVTPPAAPSAEPKDVLKLSKSEAGKGAAAAGKGGEQARVSALQEEVTAKDQALRESQSRVADLEKQIRDMQRLLDLKGAAPGKTDTKVAAAPVPEPAKTEVKPADAAKPTEPPKAADTKMADASKPADAPKPAEPVEPPKAAPVTPPKAATKPAPKKAPPPPSLLDEVLDNPLYLAGGLGILALLGGGAFMFMRRRRQAEYGPVSGLTSTFPSDLKVDTATGKSGGGLVDTGNSSFLTDFDKTGPGTIDTDEVDPVAEAEVYIAYGRDAQAEEILKEAMARDKTRPEIAVKLLEIYHARKSATAFEKVAKDLHASVGESHPLWQKAAAMGAQIDSANPLYAAAAAGGAAAYVASSAPAAAPTPDLDVDINSGAAPAPDFNLDTSAPAPRLDFDLAPPSAEYSAPAGASAPAAEEPPKEDKPAFDFDLSGLDFPGTSKPAAAAEAPSAAPSMDLADLSLDAAPGDDGGGGGEAVGTKLELAKAYLEIGDKDGAREILQEVAKEGSAAQKQEAEKLISEL